MPCRKRLKFLQIRLILEIGQKQWEGIIYRESVDGPDVQATCWGSLWGSSNATASNPATGGMSFALWRSCFLTNATQEAPRR